mgnify:CR=1 FL=1
MSARCSVLPVRVNTTTLQRTQVDHCSPAVTVDNGAPCWCYLQVPDVSKQLMHLCFKSSVCKAVLLEQLESMEAKLKVREQELRSKAQGVEDRERRVAAAAAQVAAREAECADRWRQLDRRHDNIVAREQQLGAAERHVHARAQDLGCWEQRMGPAWR